jgi:serine protease Do
MYDENQDSDFPHEEESSNTPNIPDNQSSFPYSSEADAATKADATAEAETTQEDDAAQTNHGTAWEQDAKAAKEALKRARKEQRENKRAERNEKRQNLSQQQKSRRVVAGCLAGSLCLGLGGGYLGSQIGSLTQSSQQEVIYQSVVRTVSDETTDDTSLSVSDVADLVADSVVEITTESTVTSTWMQQYVTEGAGSGVVLTENGYILTNEHVIEDAQSITVTLTDGTSYDATVIGEDSESDIAILKIDATGLTPAVLGDSDTLEVGDTAIVIGNPLGELGGTVTSGIVSALDREITIDDETMTLLQIDAAVNPGNSGGGLFNDMGELVGIVNAKSEGDGVEGLGFAIPINDVKTVITDLMSYGYVTGQTKMGVTLVDVEDQQTASYYNVDEYGVYVVEVEDGSNADNAGIKAGDRIVSLNGETVSDASDVQTFISDVSVGDVVTVVVDRDGTQKTLTMTMKETTD